MTESWFKFTD